jgi:hypothetical protein
LLLDRALWITRGWRPWTRRRHWKSARDTIRERVLSATGEDGLLPQAYGDDPGTPDASALMAVAFGMFDAGDPRDDRLVDGLIDRLGAGPYLYRYPPGGDDGFSGVEGAFLPMSFLAVTALAQLGRVEEAEQRLGPAVRRSATAAVRGGRPARTVAARPVPGQDERRGAAVSRPRPARRQANTWEPVYGADVKAHGSFDEQAYAHSPELWVSQHSGVTVAVLAGGAGLLARTLRSRPCACSG